MVSQRVKDQFRKVLKFNEESVEAKRVIIVLLSSIFVEQLKVFHTGLFGDDSEIEEQDRDVED